MTPMLAPDSGCIWNVPSRADLGQTGNLIGRSGGWASRESVQEVHAGRQVGQWHLRLKLHVRDINEMRMKEG